ncbi:hypothetical protein [Alloprevotella rava]|uniref:Uncharacterized protein n=1 Tax=Alloprevotella rava TaxID=671218 RepID=A0A7W5YE70_9BACT|nr:hypothetical protein [Alloprevotella rava]MBB3703029.1 hypothetical protein [Alloprevotella rava]
MAEDIDNFLIDLFWEKLRNEIVLTGRAAEGKCPFASFVFVCGLSQALAYFVFCKNSLNFALEESNNF